MKLYKSVFFVTAILLIPITSAFPVIQELQPAIESLNTGTSGSEGSSGAGASQPSPGPSGISALPETGFPEDTESLINTLASTLGSGSAQTGQSNEELIEQLQQELATPGQIPLWRQKRILLLLALLLLVGGLIGGFAAAGSGGSGSGASGFISSFNLNNLLDSINETNNTGDGTGDGGTGGGGGGTGGNGGSTGGGGGGSTNDGGGSKTIPEPSVMILLSSGLLAVMYARKRRLFQTDQGSGIL